jgi:hypothetical protein
MYISLHHALVATVLCLLGLGLFYALKAPATSDQFWLPWILKAGVAAGVVFVIGISLLALPGGVFVEILIGLGRKIPPDGAWPLAIIFTQVGSLLILPASLALRLIRPHVTGWQHLLATALLTFAATLLFAIVVTVPQFKLLGIEN